jgi:hypothetical protein
MFLQVLKGFSFGPVIGIVLEISDPGVALLPVNKSHSSYLVVADTDASVLLAGS